MAKKCFLHVDLDAFYASVEQLDHPEYRGKPVIVGGLPSEKRGVVSTCSYEARKFGVHSAMPIFQAHRLCPTGIFLRGNMKRYAEKSGEVMAIFRDFSPDVQQLSIDEAFIDLTGTDLLFGDGESTARNIKKRIFEETGLTVSVGMATNKYLAKIASGLSKPDGFFSVPPGDEESFMANLPLNKVWGVGEKSLAKLHKSGLYTVAQVLSCSAETLRKLLGNSGGEFLYNAVRGGDVGGFDREVKSHSVSTEQTFHSDLTDNYVIETILMQLSQEVMFRLLRTHQSTRTVQLKIRYDDFATETRQETYHSPITTSDAFYKAVLNLYRKKTAGPRGIRLLGVGANNVKENENVTKSLFDEDEKNRLVENAVLDIKKKFPKTVINKARLLPPGKNSGGKKLILIMAFLLSMFSKNYCESEEPLPLPDNESKPLFSYKLNSSDLDFFLKGFWDMSLTFAPEFKFGPDTPTQVMSLVPVFSNKADLTMSVFLNNTWFFEAAIADGLEQTSISAGYRGDKVLKLAKLGTHGITFPEYYSLYGFADLKKGRNRYSNTAPGIMASFGGSNWLADFMLRYDSSQSQEKIFYGTREVFSNLIPAYQFDDGKRFILPRGHTQNVREIFAEIGKNETATVACTDKSGRKYKKLSSGDFLLLPAQDQIILEKKISGRLVVTFTDSNLVKTDLGQFRTETQPGNGFLGETEKVFGGEKPEGERPYLKDYTHPTGEDFFVELSSGQEGLIVYEMGLFSPFEVLSKYKTYSTEVANAFIIHSQTGVQVGGYLASVIEDDTVFSPEDLKHRGFLIEVSSEKISMADFNDALKRFPLAEIHPQIYLQKNSTGDCDIVLQAEVYAHNEKFEISRSAIPGTIRVYRNGILTNEFIYRQDYGEVTMNFPVSPYDRIRITWQENSANFENGNLSIAAGYLLNITEKLIFDIAASGQWTFSEKKYNTATTYSPSTTAVSTGLRWADYGFSVENIARGEINIENVTDVYRITDFYSTEPSTMYLGSDAAQHLNRGIVPDLTPASNVELLPTHRGLETVKTQSVAGISGHGAVLTWDMSSVAATATAMHPAWVAENISLGNGNLSLRHGGKFNFALKTTSVGNNFRIFLQLGINDDEDVGFDISDEIPTFEITGFDASSTAWQTLSVEITEDVRSKLRDYRDARLIITQDIAPSKGEIIFGPYEVIPEEFAVDKSTVNKALIYSEKKSPKTPPLDKPDFLKDDDLYTVNLEWEALEESDIKFTKNIGEVPFSSYRIMSFYMFCPSNTDFDEVYVSFSRQKSGIKKEVASITFFSDFLKTISQRGKWQKVTVNLENKSISVDGKVLSDTEGTFKYDKDVDAPTSVTIGIRPQTLNSPKKLFLSEFYLNENLRQYLVSDKISVGWEKSGTVLKIKDFPLLSSPSVKASAVIQDSIIDGENKVSFSGEASASMVLAGISMNMALYRDGEEEGILSGMEHGFSFSPPVVNFSEDFAFSNEGNNSEKNNVLRLYVPNLQQPIYTTISASGSRNGMYIKQNLGNITEVAIPMGDNSLSLKFELGASQNQKALTLFDDEENSINYGESYVSLSKLQFSSGSSDATYRNTKFSFTPSLKLEKINFTPSMSLKAYTTYRAASDFLQKNNTDFSVKLPFVFGNNEISFTWTKTTGSEELKPQKGGSYLEDAQEYFTMLPSQKWTFDEAIFFDLFDPHLAERINSANEEMKTQKLFYNTAYQFLWTTLPRGTLWDLCIPTKAAFNIYRDITSSSSDFADLYTADFSLNFTSFNVFGRFSKARLIDFFEQDEIVQNYSFKMRFEQGGSGLKDWVLNSNLFIYLFFTRVDFLRFSLYYAVQKDLDFNVSANVLWERDVLKSFLTTLFSKIFPKVDLSGLRLRRSNTLEYSIYGVTKDISQSFGISHKLTIDINTNVSLLFNAALSFESYPDAVFHIVPKISVAGKLTY